MIRIVSVIFVSINSFVFVFAQAVYPVKDPDYVFWRGDLKIGEEDFKCTVKQDRTTAAVAVWTALDLPKDLSKSPKIYLAAVFVPNMSWLAANDTQSIEKQKLYIDICEIWARWARIKFSNLADSLKTASTICPAFSGIIKEMNENRLRMYRRYTRAVFMDKKPGAFVAWKDTVMERLNMTKQWATRPEDAQRFIAGQPLLDGYFEDPGSIPPLLGTGFEQILFKDTWWHAGFYQVTRRNKIVK
jgi:hypothetical protein